MIEILKALANAQRLKIVVELLNEGRTDVNTIANRIGLSQSATSQHLAWLRKSKIVSTTREAQTIYYCMNDDLNADQKRLILVAAGYE